MRYLLGVDVGTTGTKAVLCDEQGTVRATATEEYPLYSPKPLWTEQEPEDWWRACVAAIGSVLGQANVEPGALAGIGLSGQQHGSVFLDADGQVIRRALLWNDQRTAAECAEINERVGAQRILELSGNAAMPGFTAPKILWLRNHEPQHYARVAHIVMPKDYIRYRLSGDLATDANEAAGTLLQETRTRAWSDEILYKLDIPRAWLPQICEGPELTGRVSAVGAAASGLPVGLPIAAGGGDNGAAAIGTGVIRPGTLSTSLGTSGASL
jgi:xylulokinase